MVDAVGSERLEHEIKSLVVAVTGLDRRPEDIPDGQALTADGLGLDSVALLAVIIEIEERFDIEFDDDQLTPELFSSFSRLARFVEALRV